MNIKFNSSTNSTMMDRDGHRHYCIINEDSSLVGRRGAGREGDRCHLAAGPGALQVSITAALPVFVVASFVSFRVVVLT